MRHRRQALGSFDPTVSPGFGRPVTLTGADCKVRNVSDDYCKLLKRSREELINIEWPDIVHPDDVAEPSSKQAIMLSTGEPYDVRCRVLRGDGVWVRIRYRASLVTRPTGAAMIQSNAGFELSPSADTVAEEKRKAASAEYIQIIAGELAKVAAREKMTLLQHLLTMASLEAAEEMARRFPGLLGADIPPVN